MRARVPREPTREFTLGGRALPGRDSLPHSLERAEGEPRPFRRRPRPRPPRQPFRGRPPRRRRARSSKGWPPRRGTSKGVRCRPWCSSRRRCRSAWSRLHLVGTKMRVPLKFIIAPRQALDVRSASRARSASESTPPRTTTSASSARRSRRLRSGLTPWRQWMQTRRPGGGRPLDAAPSP
ncbi:MAG: hypothetical protein E6I85_01160 [Chloroflexi bacterium]|nr:MAG: hypothetical protein E6I85_01160 [Chloroflexota bacterium]